MKNSEKDKAVQIANRALDLKLRVSERVTIKPNLPKNRTELSNVPETVAKQVALSINGGKKTQAQLKFSAKSAELKFTKKF